MQSSSQETNHNREWIHAKASLVGFVGPATLATDAWRACACALVWGWTWLLWGWT